MVFGKHTPFQVLVWQMRPQVRRILFTLVYDIRANRLLTTSRLFTPLWSIWLVYTTMVNMIGLHRDGQYDWFTPLWSIWLVYTMMVNTIGLHRDGQYDWFTPWVTTMLFVLLYEKTTSRITILCFHVWTLNFEARAYIPVKLNKEATYSVLSPLSPRKLKRVTPVKRLLFKNLHWESVFGSINKYISLFTCMQCLVNSTG